MNQSNGTIPTTTSAPVRCAIYTRKSTEEGLDKEFNSLDAQRESAEAYIASQRHAGWICLPERYDDGGFTGGNMDRPALARLLADIEAGAIQAVVVYKVDRLSRSLLDFAKMMETFDKFHVSFVSVTQQFNTATSMGRLVLNVLLSFAQFEREIISERTRDKIAAARRKGKWSGGRPLLGYDIDGRGGRLLVNQAEAKRVRAIFALYVQHQGLIPVIQELERRRWVQKRWVTRKGQTRGGRAFTKTSLHRFLTNPIYAGKVRHKKEIHAGEHEAIVDPGVWREVQEILRQNSRDVRPPVRNRYGAFLKGLLHCVPCACAMTPAHSARNQTRRYRYYVCCNAQKRGWGACPSKAVPAAEIEQFVVARIQGVANDAALLRAALKEANSAAECDAEKDPARVPKPPRFQDETHLARTLATLASTWDRLSSEEQACWIEWAVERVDYDGAQQRVSVTLDPKGLVGLAEELACKNKENKT
jgi:site-specific DNA recombinase